MPYRAITSLLDVKTYLSGVSIVAFDFEAAPDEPYRSEDKAALDAHKSHIVGISFSVAESDAVYLPLAHRIGENASDQPAIREWLSNFFADPTIIKVAHNPALHERLWIRPILQIHDELVFELPDGHLNEAVIFIKTCMEQQPFEEFSVPIVAEAAAGQRFGELRELEVDL